MSGRGLGHTGGTLDKLESIPGYRTELTLDEFVAQVRDVGMRDHRADGRPRAGRQAAVRPARRHGDRRPALADRGLDHVEEARRRRAGDRPRRQGRDGAFMRTIEDARRLAETMISLGAAGRPRGRLPAHRHGPAARRSRRQRLEVREALETVRGQRAGGLHRARARCLREAARALRPRHRRGRGPASRRSGGRGRERRGDMATAGSRRRAAPPTRPRCRARRSCARSSPQRRIRRVAQRDRGSATPPSTSARAAARRRTRSTTPSASSATRSAATEVEAGEPLAEVHARTEEQAAEAALARCSRRTRSPTRRRTSGRCCSRSSARPPAGHGA